MKRRFNKRGQVWVETVLYTLIAFALMGLVLGFAKPKIQQLQDKTIIEQSISMMESIDLAITEVIQGGSGNKRLIEVAIRKGMLNVDGSLNKLEYSLEGSYIYSEPGEEIQEGNLIISSEVRGKISTVKVGRDYSNYNLTYQNLDELKIITKAATPYQIVISNKGKDSSDKTIINFELN